MILLYCIVLSCSLCVWCTLVVFNFWVVLCLLSLPAVTSVLMPSVLWRCWLDGRKGIRPLKKLVVGTGMVICLERDADLHMAQLMPLPLTVSFFSKIQIGLNFLVRAHLGSPGKRAIRRVCVNWIHQIHRHTAVYLFYFSKPSPFALLPRRCQQL